MFDIITKSYDKIGGNAKIKEPDDISREYDDWIVADTDDDPDVDVFVGGNKRGPGMKLGVSATDGSAASKAHMMQLKSVFSTMVGGLKHLAQRHTLRSINFTCQLSQMKNLLKNCWVTKRSRGTALTLTVNFLTHMGGTQETLAVKSTPRSLWVIFDILTVHFYARQNNI